MPIHDRSKHTHPYMAPEKNEEEKTPLIEQFFHGWGGDKVDR